MPLILLLQVKFTFSQILLHVEPWVKKILIEEIKKDRNHPLINIFLIQNILYFIRSTSMLESFHQLILMYCSKRFAYQYPAYKARNQLAAIDYSEHKGRQQAVTKTGKKRQVTINS